MILLKSGIFAAEISWAWLSSCVDPFKRRAVFPALQLETLSSQHMAPNPKRNQGMEFRDTNNMDCFPYREL